MGRPHVLAKLLAGAEARRVASDPALLGLRGHDPRLDAVRQIEVLTFPGERSIWLVAIDSRGNVLVEKEIS
jgi:hypothetical protein